MKRLLALFLLILTLALCFVGCDGGEGKLPSDVTDGEETDGGNAVVEENPMVISENGAYKYAIIYSSKAVDRVKELSKDILDSVAELGGTVKMGTDWAKEKQDTSEDTEILIGDTSRPESIEVLNSIGADDYAIRYIRNKIIIAAHTEERLVEAVEFFKTNLLKAGEEEGKKIVYCAGEVSFVGNSELLFTAENPLESYRIIYSRSSVLSLETARSFADEIEQKYGVKLEVLSDRTEAAGNEIVIGMTDREISKKNLTEENRSNYMVKAEGKNLLIGGYDPLVTQLAVKDVIVNDVRGYGTSLNFKADYEKSVPVFVDKAELAEGADIRVFSFNVLFNTRLKNPTPLDRSGCLVNIMTYFEPDVIGLQEMNNSWHSAYGEAVPDNYKMLNSKTDTGVINYTTIAYNTDKVKVIDHGVKTFSKGNHTSLRVASWGCFEKLDGGKRFILVNTHWGADEEDGMMVQAREMAELVNELKAKYGCPVLTTGDYNKKESTPEYKEYVAVGNLHNSKYTAVLKGNVGNTYHGYEPLGTLPSTGSAECIDHIFGTSDAEFLYFTVLLDQLALDASDHCQIVADIKLN